MIRREPRCSEVSGLLYTMKRVREEERAVRRPPGPGRGGKPASGLNNDLISHAKAESPTAGAPEGSRTQGKQDSGRDVVNE
ncbi:hypothetical protein PGIGA_G00163020 [Pangasianodon gigas]|uniref:Uncharacterized protein n=1 Tax=Pangasianodon gigas TaxID=30993 RepID=A0ACC5XRG2_PANGG|nr:hypothetical protein [Pangasianodon gigas]